MFHLSHLFEGFWIKKTVWVSETLSFSKDFPLMIPKLHSYIPQIHHTYSPRTLILKPEPVQWLHFLLSAKQWALHRMGLLLPSVWTYASVLIAAVRENALCIHLVEWGLLMRLYIIHFLHLLKKVVYAHLYVLLVFKIGRQNALTNQTQRNTFTITGINIYLSKASKTFSLSNIIF